MAKEVDLGDGNKFTSKKAATEYFKGILNAGKIDRTLDDNETEKLKRLINYHPNRSTKVGVGIDSIKISLTKPYRKRCFTIIRVDGTTEEFSPSKCIDADSKPFTEFSKACRKAIELRLHEWKVNQFESTTAKCAITNNDITYDQANVVHKGPMTFNTIVHAFINDHSFDLSSIEYLRENIFGVQFMDPEISRMFDEYHKNCAILSFETKGKK